MNIDNPPCQILCQMNLRDRNETIFQNKRWQKKKCQNGMTF
jgi:hypothetical protein